jgi:uncharacterized membrane protein YozB (DUF420 family)
MEDKNKKHKGTAGKNTSIIFCMLSILAFIGVLIIGSTIKRIEVTVTLLVVPIVFALISLVISIVNIAKREEQKTRDIVLIIIDIILIVTVTFLLLILRGLSVFT